MMGRVFRSAAGVALVALAMASGCSSDEERARDHLAKGQELRAEGEIDRARLELQSALLFAPSSVEANNELATLELQSGNSGAALVHINEAYRLDPTDSTAALNLASLLIADDPDRAESLIEGVIHRDPDNPLGYIGRSNLALARGRVPAAGMAARKAMAVAPDDPRADWHFGYVMQAMIREAQLTGEPVEDTIFESALGAFERYIKKGGEAPWNAQLEEARVMAAWEGNNPQARLQFRNAIDNARENGTPRDTLGAAVHTAAFAGRIRDWELRAYALGVLVDVEPRDFASWRALAETRKRLGKDPEETWEELRQARPEDPRAHIAYARYLVTQWKLDEALAYLSKKAEEGVDPPVLRSALASTQMAARRMDDARQTIERLVEDQPDHPRTRLVRAQLDIREGRAGKALGILEQLSAQHDDADAWLLLARSRKATDDLEGALAAADRAIELEPGFALEGRRLRARILVDQKRWPDAIRAFEELRDRDALSLDDRFVLARCRYAIDQARHGRILLEEIVTDRRAPGAALIAYAQHEGHDEEARKRVRRPLDVLTRREPGNWAALREATRLDRMDGRSKEALARLDRTVTRSGKEIPPRVRLLRAQLATEVGREEGLLDEARLAFEGNPRLPGALELLTTLYIRKGEVGPALAAAEEAKKQGAMDAQRRLLLGRLYRMNDRPADAVETLEAAAAEDAENPSLYFHMGMALQALDRREEADRALRKALAISSSFPEAENARRALEGSRSAGAS